MTKEKIPSEIVELIKEHSCKSLEYIHASISDAFTNIPDPENAVKFYLNTLSNITEQACAWITGALANSFEDEKAAFKAVDRFFHDLKMYSLKRMKQDIEAQVKE